MASEKNVSSTRRFGARYGRRLREKLGEVEQEQRKFHKCPYCHQKKVSRLAIGIWKCSKCNVKFTGKAYSVAKKITFKDSKDTTAKVEEYVMPERKKKAEEQEEEQ